MECIWIRKHKVVLFSKFNENQREAVVNAVTIHLIKFKYDLRIEAYNLDGYL
jgi:hypothetical protein